jgi:hypothetical protein
MLDELAAAWWLRFKVRLTMGVIALFIASIVASCNELRYLAFSQTTSAKVDSMYNTRSGTTVKYTFPDPETESGTRKEEDDVSIDLLRDRAVHPGDGTVLVQYIPGTIERSRIKGHNYLWLTLPLAITGVLATIFGVRFWIEFKDHERRSKATAELYKR